MYISSSLKESKEGLRLELPSVMDLEKMFQIFYYKMLDYLFN